MLTDIACLCSNTHSRATLHTDGADVVEAALLDVAALCSELLTLALEVLLLKHSHLQSHQHKHQMGKIMYVLCVTIFD